MNRRAFLTALCALAIPFKAAKAFASGGIVPGDSSYLVGSVPTDFVLPRAIADAILAKTRAEWEQGPDSVYKYIGAHESGATIVTGGCGPAVPVLLGRQRMSARWCWTAPFKGERTA
jgi:hypothetical protein